jgi:hypothetical protein
MDSIIQQSYSDRPYAEALAIGDYQFMEEFENGKHY